MLPNFYKPRWNFFCPLRQFVSWKRKHGIRQEGKTHILTRQNQQEKMMIETRSWILKSRNGFLHSCVTTFSFSMLFSHSSPGFSFFLTVQATTKQSSDCVLPFIYCRRHTGYKYVDKNLNDNLKKNFNYIIPYVFFNTLLNLICLTQTLF